MEKYTIYCTEEQTRKALELGSPIEYAQIKHVPNTLEVNGILYRFPTAEQMIGWLEEQFIRVYVQPYTDECNVRFKGKVHTIGVCTVIDSRSRKEATLAAIDKAFEYLKEQKKRRE